VDQQFDRTSLPSGHSLYTLEKVKHELRK
jgi:hypothetical protein